MNEHSIHEAVLTGGPCSGKTTGLEFVAQRLADKGVQVFIRDEIATRFILGGIMPGNPRFSNKEFQRELLLHTLECDARIRRIAQKHVGDRKLILYDRGVFDVCAYVEPAIFEEILSEENLKAGHLYGLTDAVFHLVTTAYGAQAFYTLANNQARSETAEEARALDDAIKNAWIGHEHLSVITNEGKTGEQKLQELYQDICSFMGMPVPIESERKFLVARIQPGDITVPYRKVLISQTYLTTEDGSEERIRRRTINGASTFYWTRKIAIPDSNDRYEIQKRVSKEEYFFSKNKRRDPAYRTIEKERLCFLWNNQYFELDGFLYPRATEMQLEWEATDANHILDMPPFLKVIKEVTGEKEYGNKARAKAW